MTFEKWRAKRQQYPVYNCPPQIESQLADMGLFNDADADVVMVYPDDSFLTLSGGMFHVFVENSEYNGHDLGQAETFLWEHWVVPMGHNKVDLPTNEEMAQTLFESIADGYPVKAGVNLLCMLENMVEELSPIINRDTSLYWKSDDFIARVIDNFKQEYIRRKL